MKKLLVIAFLSLACKGLYAQAEVNKTDTTIGETAKNIDTANAAKIYVIRSTGHVGSAINLRVLVDDVIYCKVRNNRFAVFHVEPGTHLFNATSWDKGGPSEKFALKMPVEAGKTYYMSMRIKQRFMTSEIFLEEITYNTAAPMLEKYKKDECD